MTDPWITMISQLVIYGGIGKKGVTTCKFVNRKFANEGLYKTHPVYGQTYINNSMCTEFSKYGYYIRKLKKDKLIHR